MSRFIRAKFVLLILLSCILGVAEASAQTNSCALRLDVSIVDTSVSLKGARATAKNADTNRIYQSVSRNGFPYFASLPEGEYELSVTRAGYKRTVDNYIVMCDSAEAGVLTTDVEMEKGSPRQTFTIARNVPAAILSGERVKLGERIDSNDNTVSSSDRIADNLPQSDGKSRPVPKIVSKGVLNGSAISLPKPSYPPAARAVRAEGTVSVQVTIDEDGNVISATAASGHPLLQHAAVSAAREAKFRPTLLSGQPVKVLGIIVYNFIAPEAKKKN
ncbi:MAG TPA: TonB family protein [Pyrinomonadaceae bacterium]|nr:TonB family protein [Pyrinomonadaceae bacterium]